MLGRAHVGLLVIGFVLGGGTVHADEPSEVVGAGDESMAPLSLSIDDALKAAVPASEQMTIIREQLVRSKATLGQTRASWLPQINTNGSYTRTLKTEYSGFSFSGDLPFGQANVWRIGLSASQLLFDGGRARAAMKAAKIGVKYQENEVVSQRALSVVEVAQGYYDAALAERRVEIAQASLEQAEQTLVSAQLGFKQGATPEFDMLRAEVARDNQVATLIQYKTQRDVAVVALKRLIGVPLKRPLVLVSKLDVDDAELQLAAAREIAEVGTGERVNLEIEAAEGNVEIAQAQVKVAKAARLPQLSVSTDFGLVNYPDDILPTSDWRTNWTVGLGASFPLFDGFRTRDSIRAAKADRAIAEARLRETKQLVEVAEVRADAAVAAATATSKQSARTVTQAQRAYEIAELRYKQGSSTHLELVDARVQLEQALLHQAQSSRDLRVALLNRGLFNELPLARGF